MLPLIVLRKWLTKSWSCRVVEPLPAAMQLVQSGVGGVWIRGGAYVRGALRGFAGPCKNIAQAGESGKGNYVHSDSSEAVSNHCNQLRVYGWTDRVHCRKTRVRESADGKVMAVS